jgi:hypothetical protein
VIADLKLHRAIETKTAGYWHKTDMWKNGIEDPEKSPHGYNHLIIGKDAQNTHIH